MNEEKSIIILAELFKAFLGLGDQILEWPGEHAYIGQVVSVGPNHDGDLKEHLQIMNIRVSVHYKKTYTTKGTPGGSSEDRNMRTYRKLRTLKDSSDEANEV